MLAEAFPTVNGKSVPFAQLRKPSGVCVNENWPSIHFPRASHYN